MLSKNKHARLEEDDAYQVSAQTTLDGRGGIYSALKKAINSNQLDLVLTVVTYPPAMFDDDSKNIEALKLASNNKNTEILIELLNNPRIYQSAHKRKTLL